MRKDEEEVGLDLEVWCKGDRHYIQVYKLKEYICNLRKIKSLKTMKRIEKMLFYGSDVIVEELCREYFTIHELWIIFRELERQKEWKKLS